MQTFSANGKLLITSEYFILDGAVGLALPVKFGQTLHIQKTDRGWLEWKSYDEHGEMWYQSIFSKHLDVLMYSDTKMGEMLWRIIDIAHRTKPSVRCTGILAETKLNFNRAFGLGTSSTLISLVAQWFQINPYKLLEQTFGGSGYDIACATATQPILFHRNINNEPIQETVHFNPDFKQNLFFVYLNKKQNSAESIRLYKNISIANKQNIIQQLNRLTQAIVSAHNQKNFNTYIDEHEDIISKAMGFKKVKDQYFGDFSGAVKSLGAWGGDFILASSSEGAAYIIKYFTEKGHNNIISYADMVRD
jgi:mevalonate kinase